MTIQAMDQTMDGIRTGLVNHHFIAKKTNSLAP
jgi:hypothetical protein